MTTVFICVCDIFKRTSKIYYKFIYFGDRNKIRRLIFILKR